MARESDIRHRALRDLGLRVILLGAVFFLASFVLSVTCTEGFITPMGSTCIGYGFGVWPYVAAAGMALLIIGGAAWYYASRLAFYASADPRPMGPACARCGARLAWVPQREQWYCSNCDAYQ